MPKPFEIYDLRVTVVAIEGRSVCGLQVGDYFELVESSKLRIPAGKFFCLYALNSVLPLLPAKQRQLDENDWLEFDTLVSCPDPEERLVMRIERIGRRVLRNTEFLLEELARLDGVQLISPSEPARRSGIVSFRSRSAPARELYRQLGALGTTCAVREGAVRLSPHFYQDEKMLETFMDQLRDLIAP